MRSLSPGVQSLEERQLKSRVIHQVTTWRAQRRGAPLPAKQEAPGAPWAGLPERKLGEQAGPWTRAGQGAERGLLATGWKSTEQHHVAKSGLWGQAELGFELHLQATCSVALTK